MSFAEDTVKYAMRRELRDRLAVIRDEIAAETGHVRRSTLNEALKEVLDWWDESLEVRQQKWGE